MPLRLLTSLVEFLYPAPAPRRPAAIFGWWERRRLAYNVFVGAAGLVSLTAVGVASLVLPGAGMVPLGPIVIFGVMANVCYLLGPLVEIALDRLWGRDLIPVGPTLYRMGLTFSVGLALLPTLLVAIALVVHLIASFLTI